MQSPMNTYTFTLVLSGIGCDDVNEETAEALYEAGCDDALFGMSRGVVTLDFDREGESASDAIRSAVRDVHATGIGVSVVRVEPDDFVTLSDIAKRTHRSRQSISQLTHGLRGDATFPLPVTGIHQRSPMWRWAEVAPWLRDYDRDIPIDDVALEQASEIARINAALGLRQLAGSNRAASRLLSDLGR